MSAPVDSLARGDAVLWRWPAGPWEWLRAGKWVWDKASISLLSVALGIAVGTGMLFNAYLYRHDLAGVGTVLMDAGLGVVVGATLVLAPAAVLYAFGYLRVPRLTLTARDLRVESCLPWRRAKIVPRSEIRATVIYEGDGAVVLMGNSGELLHVRHVGKAPAFAEALAAPTLAWPVRKPAKAVGWLPAAHIASICIFQFAAVIAALILINIIAGESIGYLPRMLGSLVGGTIIGVLLAPIPVLAIGRFFASSRTLDEFIASGIDLAGWQGRSWIWPDIAFAASTRLAIRILRIAPPPPLQPELRHGATPEMAAAMLAAAAG